MREPAPDYSSRHYERPNQAWVCGLSSAGQACPAGPTVRGECPALAECVPARDGDRWKCNRSALRGGECAEGPTPEGGCGRINRCQPTRSLRAIRGRFVTACTLLATAGLLILLSADWRDNVISPGPLARQHAQLLESNPMETDCAACHAAAEHNAAGWAASFAAGHSGRPDQSQRCMECHDETIATEFAIAAHSQPLEKLRQITQRHFENDDGEPPGLPRRDKPAGSPSAAGIVEEVACATCHREHRGAEFDLTAMNDDACQSCHRQRYESFATDHPDFGSWPYKRRTQIAFNHATHSAKHFAEKKQAFDCRSCHLDDASGEVQLLASYDAACAACHDEKIATSVAKGVPIIVLPTLDIDALKAAGREPGPWPAEASGDFDGRLPPMMKLLLAGDPAAARAIATLGPDFDFIDVEPDDGLQLEAAAALAAAIKRLFVDISQSGRNAVRERLSTVLGRDVSEAQVNLLFAGLPADAMRGAAKNWLSQTGKGDGDWLTMARGASSSARQGPHDFDPAGAWQRDDATFSLRYRPLAHADPVLAGWLEILAATPDLSERPLALAMFKELSKPSAPGQCVSCHSVDRGESGQLKIHWLAYDRTADPRGLTKFSHGPHLVLPQLADCTDCHSIKDSADTAESYTHWNPHEFVSEFAPLSKQSCVECHTAKAAGESCQKCHNYHVDAIESWRLR